MRSLSISIGAMLLFLGITQGCDAEIKRLSSALRQVLVRGNPEFLIIETGRIPAPILKACAEAVGEKEFRMAGRDEPFQIDPPKTRRNKVPRRHLLWTAKFGDIYLMHYERGGEEMTRHLVLALLSKEGTNATIMWRALVTRKTSLDNYDDFMRALQKGDIDDEEGLIR